MQMGWGNQGGDPDMFGMWMEDLGEEQSSDVDDVSPSMLSFVWRQLLRRRFRSTTVSDDHLFFRGRRNACSGCRHKSPFRHLPCDCSDGARCYCCFLFGQNESLASVSSSDRDRRRRERKNIARELLDTEDK